MILHHPVCSPEGAASSRLDTPREPPMGGGSQPESRQGMTNHITITDSTSGRRWAITWAATEFPNDPIVTFYDRTYPTVEVAPDTGIRGHLVTDEYLSELPTDEALQLVEKVPEWSVSAATIAKLRAAVRLEDLRVQLRAGTMSYGELADLQGMVRDIPLHDLEMLEAAGVPEQAVRYAEQAIDG